MEYTWSSCCNIDEDKKQRRPLNEAFIQCSNQPTEKCSKIQYRRFYCGLNLYPTTCILITDVLPEGDGASLDGATWWSIAASFCMHVHLRHNLVWILQVLVVHTGIKRDTIACIWWTVAIKCISCYHFVLSHQVGRSIGFVVQKVVFVSLCHALVGHVQLIPPTSCFIFWLAEKLPS